MIDIRTETLLTVAAAARRLGKTADTVRIWINRGLLEGIHIAGKLHTSIEAIERVSHPVDAQPRLATGLSVAEQREHDERQRKALEYLRAKGIAR